MNGKLTVCVLALCGAACARTPARAPVLVSNRAVAVLPPNNRTGDPLLIAGASFYEKYVARSDRITVPDVLAAEARLQLVRRGFTVTSVETVEAATGEHAPADAQEAAAIATHNKIDASVLYIDLRRWEADVPFHPQFVIASLKIALIDPTTGRILWSADHPSRPVPTQGVVNLGDAYAIAARTVMQEMLANLGAERPPS